ncbi:MAG: DHH family phosphoesterase [candidate division WOR-3 bacterium]
MKTMDDILIQRYANAFNIPYELACIISKRFPDYNEAKKFLYPEIDHLKNPLELPDIQKAVEILIEGIKNNENILIYTHDDPDGYTSATLLYQTLLDIRRKGSPYIFIYPINREKDGYVLNPEVLKEYIEKGVKILVTVDFGISNPKNFEVARELGLRLVICDHHETDFNEFLVPAVDPKRKDSKYPFRELAGVGVTLKLCQMIYKTAFGINDRDFFKLKKEFTAIAMIGTLADRVMPLDENRIICYEGLKAFREIDKPWARHFLTDNSINIPYIFNEIIPLLQSAALEDSQLGIDFFISPDFLKVVEKLKSIENARKENIEYLFQIALNVAKVYPNIVISVIPYEAINEKQKTKINNLGAVVSKLRDNFHKTAVAMIIKEGKCYAELRSYDINLFEFLNRSKELFIDFGGHRRAAGFSMFEKFLDKFVDYATKMLPEPTIENKKKMEPEAIIDKSKIKLLEPLLPFGEGNPSPLLTDGIDLYTIDNRLNIIEIGLWQT